MKNSSTLEDSPRTLPQLLPGKRQSLLLPISGLLLLIVAVLVVAVTETQRVDSVISVGKNRVVTLLPLVASINMLASRSSIHVRHARRLTRLSRTTPSLAPLAKAQVQYSRRVSLVLSAELTRALHKIQKLQAMQDMQPYAPELAGMQSAIIRAKEVNQRIERKELNSARASDATGRMEEALLSIDHNLSIMASEFAQITEKNLTYGEAHRDEAIRDMIIFGIFVLLIATALVLRIRSLQKNLIEAEKVGLVGKMAIMLSHEINNPLAAILGNTYLLINRSFSPEQEKEMTQAIDMSARRIADVIRKVGEIDRITTTTAAGGVEMLDLDTKPR